MRIATPTSRALATGLLAVALAIGLAACGAGSGLVGVQEPPTEVTTTAPISAHNAEEIATRVLAKAAAAESAPAAEAKALRAEALSGAALAVANAADQLDATQAKQAPSKPVTRADPPKVLSISRGTQWPRLILAQSTAANGGAVLNVLVSPDAKTPFRLAMSATMHPGSSVSALDSLADGSPRVTDGTDVAIAPDELMAQYAASLAYPKPPAAPAVDADDPFSTSVRANAAAQAKSFGKLATLTQRHVVERDRTITIALKGGGVLVFGLMERTDTIKLAKGGKSLNPSPEFQRLVKKKTLSKSAELKSYETVVFTVPDSGRAVVVGADEVLFSAKGA